MPKISDFCGYCGVPFAKSNHPMAGMKHKDSCDRPSRVSPVVDPWVKVGTTTIDGLISHVVERIGGDANDLMGWRTPRLIGGQMLVGHEFGATQDGMVVMRCDIVRRKSEIDAEQKARTEEARQRLLAIKANLRKPFCPECGPHGNRGEVLLASSWAKCTTCAGGKPGDLWGEVKPSEEPKYWSSVANKMVTFAKALALGRSLRPIEDA